MRTDNFGGATEHRAFEVAPIKGRTLEGYAAPFNSPAQIGDFIETIAPGAFKRSLESRSDVLALFDHSPEKLLGRTRSGTLKLSEDDKGLRFELAIPDTQAGNDVVALAQRGDLGGMSFGFTIRDNGEEWNGNNRTLRSVVLKEVSVISSWPAYERTAADLALRHADHLKKHQTGVALDMVDRRCLILAHAEAQHWV
ncbi:MAG: HK97 family phage prohead protease [Pseudomonadota bacterium]